MTPRVLVTVLFLALLGMTCIASAAFIPPVSNGEVTNNVAASAPVDIYIPPKPCVVCPEPTPTPVPPEYVGVDCTYTPSNYNQERGTTVTFTGFQTSGTPFSSDVKWQWNMMYTQGSLMRSKGLPIGQTTSFTIKDKGIYTIQMRVVDETNHLKGILDKSNIYQVR